MTGGAVRCPATSLDILAAAWSGELVHHRGPHYTVDGIQFLPRPVQRHGAPVWAAGFPGNVKPLHRAARCQGFFPVNLDHPDQLAEAVAAIAGLRAHKLVRFCAPSRIRTYAHGSGGQVAIPRCYQNESQIAVN